MKKITLVSLIFLLLLTSGENMMSSKLKVYAMCGIFGGDRNAALKKISDALTASKTKHIVISADAIRDELYKEGKDFSTLYDLIGQRVNLALDSGHSVILDSDNSGFKKTIWLYKNFGLSTKIDKVQTIQTQESVLNWVNNLSNEEAKKQLPWYFQDHRDVRFQDISPGPTRGVATALMEVARHLLSYEPDKNGNLVYKHFW